MEQLLPFVNIADHILHSTQINSFVLGTVLVNYVLTEIIFYFCDDQDQGS